MADSEDHREKNILLAKNLNEVKMDLRCKKKDIASLQTQLRLEQQRNSKLEMDQVSILDRIDTLKRQLDDTFLKNTLGYMNLSKQIDEMHQDSIQNISDISMLSPLTSANSMQSLFLKKIKMLSESLTSNVDNHEASGSSSKSANSRHSLSFNSFEIGMNSTFVTNKEESVKDADDEDEDSELNRTFLTEQPENQSQEEPRPLQETKPRTLLCEEARNTNITMRRANRTVKVETPKVKNKITKYRSRRHKENRSDISPLLKKMVLRRAKKIDYSETSFRRNK